MIRKPDPSFGRRSPTVDTVRTFASGAADVARAGHDLARAGTYLVRGLICWAVALLWGTAALAAGLSGGLPTFIGVGAMAAGMGWMGTRMFAKARSGHGAR